MEPYKFNLGQSVVIDTLCAHVGDRGVITDRCRVVSHEVEGDDGDCEHVEMSDNSYKVRIGGDEDWYLESELERYVEPFKEER